MMQPSIVYQLPVAQNSFVQLGVEEDTALVSSAPPRTRQQGIDRLKSVGWSSFPQVYALYKKRRRRQ